CSSSRSRRATCCACSVIWSRRVRPWRGRPSPPGPGGGRGVLGGARGGVGGSFFPARGRLGGGGGWASGALGAGGWRGGGARRGGRGGGRLGGRGCEGVGEPVDRTVGLLPLRRGVGLELGRGGVEAGLLARAGERDVAPFPQRAPVAGEHERVFEREPLGLVT